MKNGVLQLVASSVTLVLACVVLVVQLTEPTTAFADGFTYDCQLGYNVIGPSECTCDQGCIDELCDTNCDCLYGAYIFCSGVPACITPYSFCSYTNDVCTIPKC
jgi:hypothetical protein